MHIYRIDGNTVQVVCCPPEDVRKGDYLLIRDVAADRGLIVQVINTEYANIPGILEDILRESSWDRLEGRDLDILRMRTYIDMIKDAKIFSCKVRRALDGERLDDDATWTPNRSTSRLMRLSDEELMKLISREGPPSIEVGTTKNGARVTVDASRIDGKLSVITGKKGTGKSHLAKLLVLGLASLGGVCVVLDVNGEYVNLGHTDEGGETPINGRILALSPGENFRVTLEYAGLGAVLSIMSSVLDLPASSAWEFRRIWGHLSASKNLSLARLEEAIYRVNNDFIRDALLRRFETMASTRFFTDDEAESTTLEERLRKIEGGGALVINLSNMPSSFRRIAVEFVLRKLSGLLERWFLRAVFLFAEEAHLYLRETYWDDIVTRMRHMGVFTTFITNQPESLEGGIYRQADNIFLFNFTNESDLSVVSRAAKVDMETVNSIARELPPRSCLALGEVVDDFPLVVEVKPLKVRTMGETRLFFGGGLGELNKGKIYI